MKIDLININSSFTKFKDNQGLDFSKKDNKCIFIYGSNGTGKSSISKLFSICNMKLEGNDEYKERLSLLKTMNSKNSMSVNICYDDESFTSISDEIINPIKIPVFNKDYIDSKITYQKDFKNNLFQEQTSGYGIEFESKTNYNNKLIEINENNLKQEELTNIIVQKIDAGISQTIKDTNTTKSNQKYNDYSVEKFINLNSKKVPITGLDKIRENHIKYITNLKDFTDDDIVEFPIEIFADIENLKSTIIKINGIIKFSEDKSKLNFVKEYLDKFDEDEKNWKIQGATFLKNKKCPFCEQNVSDSKIVQMYQIYIKSNLIKTENFIKEQINYFEKQNDDIKLKYEIIETKIKNIDKIFNADLNNQIEELIKKISDFENIIIGVLKRKLADDNLYNDCSNIIKDIKISAIDELNLKYDQLLKNMQIINNKILRSSTEKKKANEEYLDKTGKFIVYNSVREELEELNKIRDKSQILEKELNDLKAIYQQEIREKNELVRTINNILEDFTITNYRIDDKFDLFLNEQEVSKNVEKLLSDGEKNIIAFALFISELKLLYSEQEKGIIVIDDPITSVDYPNLYSIYNYINNIINENKNSQIIITSHNILFMNLFKFYYRGNALYYKLKKGIDSKTEIVLDDNKFDSIYLEKLKVIYDIAVNKDIKPEQKLYIHNYCRYVIETLSRFEYPDYKSDSTSSQFYINKLKEQIKDNPKSLNISSNNLDTLYNIINKGSHATIEIVHDNELFEDNHYIKCCNTIIEIIRTKYNGQYNFLTNDAVIEKKECVNNKKANSIVPK